MIDPAEQLRRLAESRADRVEPFTPDELARSRPADGAVVVPFIARRRPAAVAASVLAVAAIGAGAFAVFGGTPTSPDEAAADGGGGALDTTSTVLDDVVVPDVVDRPAGEAAAELNELGLDATFDVLFVAPGDDRAGRVVAMSLPEGMVVPEGEVIELQVARVAPTSLSEDACQRPAHLLGTFDDDRLLDAVHPRHLGGDRIVEVEVCTAAGARIVVGDLRFPRIADVVDLDGDGVDEIIGPIDDDGSRWEILAVDEGALVRVDGVLAFGPRTGEAISDWWGCHAFTDRGIERLAVGTWTDRPDGRIAWELTEYNIVGGEFRAGVTVHGEGPAADGVPGRDRCEPPPPVERPNCAVTRLDAVVIGDLDGDGGDDWVSPRDDLVCWSDGVTRAIGPAAATAEIWFLDDIEDDGRLELFLGSTTYAGHRVRPFAFNEGRGWVPAADADCCAQDLPRQILPEDTDYVGRWFSCVAASASGPAELLAGTFRHPGDGTVEWTITSGSRADPEVTHRVDVGDPRSIDAWRPGNGCRGTAPVWRTPVTFAFDDDGTVGPTGVDAFNAWVAGDDPDRILVRLREALRVSDLLVDADRYAEDIEAGTIDVIGGGDDSVAATRFTFGFDETGRELTGVRREWACRPGSGHEDFGAQECR